MLKLIVTAAIVSLAAPVLAMDMKCDEASMMKMETEMGAMKDMAKKEMAMKEMEMAKTSMKANKMDDCVMHMDNAAKGMM